MRPVDEGMEKVDGVSMGVAEKKGETKRGRFLLQEIFPGYSDCNG
jgi:hypothetical protein